MLIGDFMRECKLYRELIPEYLEGSIDSEFKNSLDKQILFEKKRADEEIIERKLDFGENIDSDN